MKRVEPCSIPQPGPTKLWPSQVADETTNPASSASGGTNNTVKLGVKTEKLMKTLLQNESVKKKVEFITLVTIKYLEIVAKQTTDTTIKYIASFLVMRVLNFIGNNLVPALLKKSNFKALTEDCEEDFNKKAELEAICSTLKDALFAVESF